VPPAGRDVRLSGLLIPAAVDTAKPDVRKVIEEMKRFQAEQGPTLGPDLSIRDLIEEGRRF